MKRMEWLYCLILIVAIFHPSNVQASAQAAPQIVYLGSEVDGPDLYNNYLVSCEIEVISGSMLSFGVAGCIAPSCAARRKSRRRAIIKLR